MSPQDEHSKQYVSDTLMCKTGCNRQMKTGQILNKINHMFLILCILILWILLNIPIFLICLANNTILATTL